MRAYNNINNSENMGIQHTINSLSINKNNNDDYIQTRKVEMKRKMRVADTPNKRNNCSIRRDEMPLTETVLALDDLNKTAVSSNPGGYLTKFNTGMLRPEVKPLTLLYTILAEKVPLLCTFY